MSSFDAYNLAANCAQFPLPVITGIGHERDDTVLDMVAHIRLKTPTAVAEFLIGRMDKAAVEVENLQGMISDSVSEILLKNKNLLQLLGSRLPVLAVNRIEKNRAMLQRWEMQIPVTVDAALKRRATALDTLQLLLKNRTEQCLSEYGKFIQLTEQFIKMASPDYVLKRGYSLTLKEGRIMKKASDFHPGERLVTRFSDGEITSVVE